jgi:LPXTG-site transpeptidase (sortase) family protein
LGLPSEATAVSGTTAFHSVAAARVFDSKTGGSLVANRAVSLAMTGDGLAPSGTTAAVLNVVASSATSSGGIRFAASGVNFPLQSTMNLPSPGTEVVQTITVPVGTDGKIQVISSASVNLVVDLLGYYSPAVSAKSGRFRTLAELKILDRSISPLPIGGLLDLKLPAAVPRDAEAVVMTITVSGAIRSGSWYHTSSGRSVPIVASRSGEITSNTFLARPTSGSVTISTDSGGFATVTISGWYTGRSSTSGSDGLFVPQAPLRLLDTTSPLDPLGPGVALHSSWTLESTVSGAAGVPSSGVGAVSIVLGSRNSMGAGRTTVYAAGQVRPDVGHITATRVGHATSTSLQVAVGERGLAVYSEPGSDITVDVVGWFTGQPQTSVVPRPVNAMPPAERFPGVLWVPDIKLFTMVREDTSLVDLDPSHLPESRSPNQPGNVAIFGHRTSHGREFRNLDQMKQGSMIVLAVGGKIYWYSTTAVEVLTPEDPLLYASYSGEQTLTLVACHPPGSVKFRIVVRATLMSITGP